jgi:hypothetical protein
MFFRRKGREVRKSLHRMDPPDCGDGACSRNHEEWREELMH